MSDTEVGGIKGYLLLDDSDWDAKIDQAIAKAEELKRANPDVRVTAETEKAQAELEAVEATVRDLDEKSATVNVEVERNTTDTATTDSSSAAAAAESATALAAAEEAVAAASERAATAEAALGAARAAQANSDTALSAAEAELAAARESQTATAEELATTQAALTAADAALAAATDEVAAAETKAAAAAAAAAAAEEALTISREESAAAAETESAAAAEEAAANSAAGAAAGGASKQTLLMVGAIAAVVSLLGPAAAATVAIGGGFLGMASAGVLAVVGIKNAMTDGTQVGQQYSAGMKDLKGDLDELGSTAAISMLGAFQQAEQTIGGDLPELNTNVSILAGYLGRSGNNLLDGVVNGLETAEPLFEEGAALIERWTQGFDRWASGGGLQSFVSYAQTELPRVATSVEDLADDVVILVDDLKPLGDVLQDIGYGVHGILQIGQAFSTWKDSLSGSGAWGVGLKTLIDSAEAAVNPIKMVETGVQGLQPLIDRMTGSTQQGATASERAANADSGRLTPVKQLTTAENDLTDAQDKATAAAQKWQDWVNAQNNDALKLAQATSTLQGDYNTFGQTVTSNLQTMTKAQATSLDVNTAAGLQNHNMILTSIQDAENQAAAVYQSQKEQGASTVDATNTSNAALQAAKTQIEQHAAAAGLDKGQVDALVDSILAIPANVKSTIDVDASGALKEIDLVNAAYATVQRNITTTITTNHIDTTQVATSGGVKLANAHGGTIEQRFALGGTSGTVSGSVGSSTSDSLITRLGIGEEVVNTAAASFPGVRPILKSFNADPKGTMSALASPGSQQQVVVTFVDQTTGGLMQLVDSRVEVKTKQQQKAAAVASIGGSVL